MATGRCGSHHPWLRHACASGAGRRRRLRCHRRRRLDAARSHPGFARHGVHQTRNLPLILLLPLAAIGLLERFGLKEHAQTSIAKIRSATAGRLLIFYLFVRELSAAFGLTSLGGHASMVRPLVSPMAEAAAELQNPSLPEKMRHRVRAMAAATDNVGLFFGEDVFVAFGAIVLMQTILNAEGIAVNPLHIAMWGIPTAITAFIIHAWRLGLLDGQIRRAGDAQ
jgi:uncharacterized membrane protein